MTGESTQAMNDVSSDDGWEWAVIEIFGHRSHAGRTREVEQFGTKMLRVDVPIKGDPAANGWETHFYGGAAIFSFTLTTESDVMQANRPYEPAARYRIPDHRSEPTVIDCGGDDQDELEF